MGIRKLCASALLLILIAACESTPPVDLSAISEGAKEDPIPAELREAPERVYVGDLELKLGAALWRGLDLDDPSRATGIGVELGLTSASFSYKPQEMPAGVTADTVWVIQSDKMWSKAVTGSSAPGDRELEWVAQDGPAWEPGSFCDVVLQFYDSDEKRYLIQTKQQEIFANY